MPSGGDHRPLARVFDASVEYGALLLRAMWRVQSPGATRFQSEFTTVFERHRRLLTVLRSYEGLGRPAGAPGELRALSAWLDRVEHAYIAEYPRQRPVSAPLHREWADRVRLVDRRAIELSRDADDPEHPLTTEDLFGQVRALRQWAAEPLRAEAVEVYRRSSQHRVLRRFRAEIVSFAESWGLHAWWAESALIHSQLCALDSGALSLMPDYAYAAEWLQTVPLIVRVPGTSDARFEADRRKLRSARLSFLSGGPTGSHREVTRRPTRAEFAAIESITSAACVVYDWDPALTRHPARPVERAIAQRLGRPLKTSERRALRASVDAQVRAAGQTLATMGFKPATRAQLNEHAAWLAIRLLDPGVTWDALTTGDMDRARAARRACTEFASRAELRWPVRRSGPRRS